MMDDLLHTYVGSMSSAWHNRMRLAYFASGAPFGRSQKGVELWIFFQQRTTSN